jgi:hypothetical protein
MKNAKKKLSLKKVTVSHLINQDMKRVAAGQAEASNKACSEWSCDACNYSWAMYTCRLCI